MKTSSLHLTPQTQTEWSNVMVILVARERDHRDWSID